MKIEELKVVYLIKLWLKRIKKMFFKLVLGSKFTSCSENIGTLIFSKLLQNEVNLIALISSQNNSCKLNRFLQSVASKNRQKILCFQNENHF